MGTYAPGEEEERWLRLVKVAGFEVPPELYAPIFDEMMRIEPLFNRSSDWRAWWSATSKAPALDLEIMVVWPKNTPPDDYFHPERVSRGRKQHWVRLHVDAGRAEALAPEERHGLTLPAVFEALDRLVTKLRLDPPPEQLPEGVQSRG